MNPNRLAALPPAAFIPVAMASPENPFPSRLKSARKGTSW